MAIGGLFIVLEGSDGSGKTTQFKLLSERLKAAGYDVAVFDFPRYDKDSSYFVKQYLNGKYGPAEKISPYTASLFYAMDRYEAAEQIRKELKAGKIVIADRYVGSNMAHQGAKFDDPVEQRGFFVWEDNLEFHLLNIPRPDISIYLRVPAKTSYNIIAKRAERSYTKNVRDEHEANLEHLKKAVATYDLLCQLFPKDFAAIECSKDGQLMSIPQISNLIWQKIFPELPTEKPHAGHSAVVTLNSNTVSPKTTLNSDDKLIHQFSNASLLLKLQIERYLKAVEPQGLNIWSDNGYKYYTPTGMPKNVAQAYRESIERVAQLHRQMTEQLEQYYEKNLLTSANGDGRVPNTTELLLPVTPLAALSDFNVMLSDRSVKRVASSLLSSDTLELQWAAQQLYVAAKQQWPEDFKQPLESDTAPEPINHIIAKLAEDKLSLNSGYGDDIKLLEASPRQEFDLLAETIYPYSNLSLEEITEEVADWSYQQKYESLKQAAAESTGLLEKIKYKFDLITDQITMSDVLNTAVLNNVQAQQPSPRYGYEVPAILDDIGIDSLYLDCFDESLKLFSLLQEAGLDSLTVYATLLGHKLRWQFSADAKNIHQIINGRPSEAYFKTAENIKDKVSLVHPLTWEVLSGGLINSAQHVRRNRVKPSRRRNKKNSKPPRAIDK